jgi:hypothetical protein
MITKAAAINQADNYKAVQSIDAWYMPLASNQTLTTKVIANILRVCRPYNLNYIEAPVFDSIKSYYDRLESCWDIMYRAVRVHNHR